MKKKAAPVAAKINLRKDDMVIVIAGKDKDRKTPRKVVSVVRDTGKVIVEGVNLVKDTPNKRAQQAGGEQGIVQKAMPIHASNVMLVDPKSGTGTRVRRVKGSDGKVSRVAVKSGQTF